MNHMLLSEVSLAFAGGDPLGEQLGRALHALCRGLQLSRAYVYIDGQNQPTMGYTHEWCADGIAQQWLDQVPHATYGAWKQALEASGRLVASDTAALPGELRALAESHGIRSLQAYPILFGQEMFGFCGFDDSRRQRTWTDGETELLRAASSLISAFCERELMREHFRVGRWVSDEEAAQAEIRDSQTGAYTQQYVQDRLTGFDAEYARLGRNFCISVLEVDDFQAIKSVCGEAAARDILREMAGLIASTIRPYDISGRYEGDAFVIVSVNASAREAGYLVDRLLSLVGHHVFISGEASLDVAVSYGIADSSEFLPEEISIDGMLKLAEERLQAGRKAKRDSRSEAVMTE